MQKRGADQVGANRAMRRRQVREQLHEWTIAGEAEKVRRIAQNGLTQKDLDEAYNNGYANGHYTASRAFFRQMYASIAKELHEAGNDTDDIISFLKGVDSRFAIMYDADEEINEVFDLIGIRINVDDREVLDKIEVIS